jgi:ribosome-associated protein
MRLNKLQKTAVTALEDIKARDITVLDVRKLTSLYDTLIVASAESNRQVKALAGHVRDKLKAAGATIIGVEGEESGEWVLVDAGDIVVHVMQPAVRAYYNLEELWTPPAPVRRTKPTGESGTEPKAEPVAKAAPKSKPRAAPKAGARTEPGSRAKGKT